MKTSARISNVRLLPASATHLAAVALMLLQCLLPFGARGAESPASIVGSRVIYSGFSFGGTAEIIHAASTYSEKFNGVQDQTGNYSYTKLNATQGRISYLTANNPGGSLQPDTITFTVVTDYSGTWVNADMSESGTFTVALAPEVTTLAATSVTTSGATLNAGINPNNAATTAQFQYGLTTSYGATAAITLSPNNGTLDQGVGIAITGLTPNTTYHFRAVATNGVGGTVGSDLTFTTAALAPPVITQQPQDQSASEGEPGLFLPGVTATGDGPFTYQWRKDGTNISDGPGFFGTTTRFFDIVNATTNLSGSYSVVVTGAGGSVTNTPFTITIRPRQTLISGVPLTGQASDPTSPSQRIYYNLTVPAGATRLVVTTTGGTGDADLRVKRGQVPQLFVNDGTSATAGNSESITINNPVAGEWFISLSGSSYAGVTVLATITALATVPTVTTLTAMSVTISGATLTGSINPNGTPTVAQFQYGPTTSYGSTAAITLSPNDGSAGQNVSVAITGLAANTLYHFRAVATNSGGGTVGSDLTFTTLPLAPVITSALAATGIVGQAFTYQITANNSPTSYSVDGLPPGLTVNPGTGLISGTPTVAGTSNVTVSASNAGGTGLATLSISVGGVVAPGQYTFTTLAGLAGSSGSTDGTGSAARFSNPVGVAVDAAGNLYVADAGNHTIRRVTPNGSVTTLAGLAGISGGTDGTGNAARFSFPTGVAVDSAGNLYAADINNRTIRKVTSGGVVTTLVGLAGSFGSTDGTGSAARFGYPWAVAVDSAENVYVADGNATIRKVMSGGVVTTLAGLAGSGGSDDGSGSIARFGEVRGVAVDVAGNVYVADTANHTIRKVTPGGAVTTLAGLANSTGSTDGTGSTARFNYPVGVAVDGAGNIYVGDQSNHTIRKVTPGGVVTTLAGLAGSFDSTEGTGNAARFYHPAGVAVDSVGNLYVADQANHTIRKGVPMGAVSPPVIISGLSATAVGGQPFTYQITANNMPTSFNATGLPPGLSINTSSGLISGTPTGAGTNFVTLSASNAAGTGTATLALTVNVPPAVSTSVATSLTSSGATLTGSINPNGTPTVAQFQYGTTTSYGSTATIPLSPNNGSAGQNVSVAISGLAANTLYHFRAVATNSGGGTVGSDLTFTTLGSGVSPGSLDLGFDPNVQGPVFPTVYCMAIQPDGRIVIGGQFSMVRGMARTNLARLNADGSLDESFNASANDIVYSLSLQPDQKIVVGGYFTTIGGQERRAVARLNPDGTLDGTFNLTGLVAGLSGVHCTLIQGDGKILIGGEFTVLAQVFGHTHLARLNSDGTVDTTFHANADQRVMSLALQADGKLVVGGDFLNIESGITYNRSRMARLNADGTLDLNFAPSAGGSSVSAVVIQGDGKIVVGGGFTHMNGVARANLARLNPDGTIDTGFAPNANDRVDFFALQTDGRIIIGGQFTSIGGAGRNRLARLNADGTVDTGFAPVIFGYSGGIALQADGKIILGGQFSSISGTSRTNIARLANDPATQSLSVLDATRVQWLRGGASPEVQSVSFELSSDGGNSWRALGPGARIVGGWQSVGLGLPRSGQVRARAYVTGGAYNGSSSMVEAVTAFAGLSPAVPEVFSLAATSVTNNAALLNAIINPNGAATVAQFVYGTTTNYGSVVSLTLSPNDGTLAQTVSAAISGLAGNTTYHYRVVATNNVGGTVGSNLTFTTLPFAPVITSAGTAAGTLGQPFSYQTTASGSPTSFNATGLPPGLSINITSGLISGTPTVVGTSTVILSASNTGGIGTLGITLTVTEFADNFADRIQLIGATVTTSANNQTATPEAGEPSYVNRGRSVWWTWTAPAGGPVTIDTVGSSFDTVLGVYTGNILGSLTTVGEDDDSGGERASRINFTAVAGQVYQIAVDGYNSLSGNITLNLSGPSAPSAPVITSASTATGTVGQAFSYQITATNNPTSFNAVGLPPGLSVNPTTGLISGTPTVAGSSNVTLSASNAGGVGVMTLTISVSETVSSGQYTFTTLAGLAGSRGSTDGAGSAARFDVPFGVAVDGAGSVYVADAANHTIRKVTPDGVVITLAGLAGVRDFANGTGSAARFASPVGVAVDGAGNVYVADSGNHLIRKVTPGGVVTTLAGLDGSSGSANGTGSTARFSSPQGVAVDGVGNVYVADYSNSAIRKVTPGGVVTTLAGFAGSSGSADGTGNAARFAFPSSLAVDGVGNVYVADTSNQTIRKVTPGGVVTTLAGLAGSSGSTDGTGSGARFFLPYGVAADSVGNVYVTDRYNQTIRKMMPGGVVTTLVGLAGSTGSTDGTGSAVRFNYPAGMAVDGVGNLYVADVDNHTIRKGVPSGPLSPPVITSTSTATAVSGQPFTYQITANNVPTSFNATGLPAGLRINTSSGLISGTPTGAGTNIVTLSASNAAGTGVATLSISVGGTPPTNAPGGIVIDDFSAFNPTGTFNSAIGGSPSTAQFVQGNGFISVTNVNGGDPVTGAYFTRNVSLDLTGASALALTARRDAGDDSVSPGGTLLELELVDADGSAGYFYVSATNFPTSGFGTITLPLDTNTFGGTVAGLNLGQIIRYGIAAEGFGSRPFRLSFDHFAAVSTNGPVVQSAPMSTNVFVGGTVALNVVANGAAPLTYQWQFNGASLAGATNAALTLANVQPGQGGNYTVVVSNGGGSVTSAPPALLTVTSLPAAGAVREDFSAALPTNSLQIPTGYVFGSNSTPPGRAQNPSGVRGFIKTASADWRTRDFTMEVTVSIANSSGFGFVGIGSGTPDGAFFGEPGASAYLRFAPGDFNAGNGLGRLAITHTSGFGTSRIESYFTQAAGNGTHRVRITKSGGNVFFAAHRNYAGEPFRPDYLISKGITNELAFLGATNSTLFFGTEGPGTSFDDLVILPDIAAPLIFSSLQSQTVLVGGSPSFLQIAQGLQGTGPFTFQWLLDGNPILGATNVSYTITNAQASQAGSYAVQVSNAAGRVLSSAASLTVMAPPAITIQPQSQVVIAGTNVTFSVTATGTPPLAYQWFRNGLPVPGASAAVLNLAGVNRAVSGVYTVGVTNGGGGLLSSNAFLRVLVPQRFQPPMRLGDGRVRLVFGDNGGGAFQASDATNFIVYASTEATGRNASWTTVTGSMVLTNGQFMLEDTGAIGKPRRFYFVVDGDPLNFITDPGGH